ncbi:MAG: hypothetical protein EOO99_08855 [Pedobacter sp.]|nr:MAG: hypothetical protein EOO99_08855 [Pedobacter sp.]
MSYFLLRIQTNLSLFLSDMPIYKYYFFLLLFLSSWAFPAWAQPTVIVNKLTDQHVYVRETKVSIIPPQGATIANPFVGFTLPHNLGTINVSSVPVQMIQDAKRAAEQLKQQGFEVLKMENYRINNLPARLTFSSYLLNGFKQKHYQLMLEVGKETIILNAHFAFDQEDLEEALKKSLLSVVYDAKIEVKPKDVLPFKVSTAGTRFKLAKTTPTTLSYSTDGQFPPASRAHSMFIVMNAVKLDQTTDKKQWVLESKKQNKTITSVQVAFINEITIDGLDGYEVYFKGKSKDKGLIENHYEVFLFSPFGAVYKLSGLTADPTNKTLEEFKKIARTFERF